MNHFAFPRFWHNYRQLPIEVRELADKNYQLLRANPRHPSLRLKKVGNAGQFWSVRIGRNYRALGLDQPDGVAWFWIGPHDEYSTLLG